MVRNVDDATSMTRVPFFPPGNNYPKTKNVREVTMCACKSEDIIDRFIFMKCRNDIADIAVTHCERLDGVVMPLLSVFTYEYK